MEIDRRFSSLKRKKEIKVKFDDFDFLRVIGQGSYGKVYLVEHKHNLKHFAIKTIQKRLVYSQYQDESVQMEREIITSLDHPFIVKLQYAFQDRINLYMVMEFVNGGELFYHLHKSNRNGFPLETVKFYAAQLVLMLEYMHSQGVIYRDLKPENILIDAQGYLRLIDFGLSSILDPENDAAEN